MKPAEGYEPVNTSALNVEDVIILERKHFKMKTGEPVPSTFYRCVVGEHKTVSGMMKHLVNEPDFDWPQIAEWGNEWVYAGNDGIHQMWKKEKSDDKRASN